MKYYIISGEASGDLHAAKLIAEIKNNDKDAIIRGWGGDKMIESGAEVVKHYKDLAFMGFLEVLRHLKTIVKNFKFCKKDILQFNPDALILIDYPGFNLPIAKFAKKNNIKTYYYIAPQVWAWKKNRIHPLVKNCEMVFVIMAFELDIYKKHGYKAYYVGHPIVDSIKYYTESEKNLFLKEINITEKKIISILPGSRKQEITKMLPLMLKVATKQKDFKIVVSKMKHIEHEIYSEALINYPDVLLLEGNTDMLLQNSYAAIVTSGTITLETALYKVPQIVCYKTSDFSYKIAKSLVKINYISLVNLILNKKAVTELIQNDFNQQNLENNLKQIIYNLDDRKKIIEDYENLSKMVGCTDDSTPLNDRNGVASRAVNLILENLKKENETN